MKIRLHLIIVVGIFFLALLGGTFAYSYVEGWGFLNSLYFVIVTVTTIGYGDLVPITLEGKVFTMFFAFFGVATALYVFSTVSSSLFKKHVGAQVSKLKKDVKEDSKIKEDIQEVIKKEIKKR